MARATFVYRNGLGLVDKRDAPPLVTRFARAPGIIRDAMDPIPHPCTGVLMDSKAAFRAVTRAHGCDEIGSESPAIRHDAGAERAYSDALKRDIHSAMQMTDHAPADAAAAVFGTMGAAVPTVAAAANGWL